MFNLVWHVINVNLHKARNLHNLLFKKSQGTPSHHLKLYHSLRKIQMINKSRPPLSCLKTILLERNHQIYSITLRVGSVKLWIRKTKFKQFYASRHFPQTKIVISTHPILRPNRFSRDHLVLNTNQQLNKTSQIYL